jgi:tripartite-type tricarboxylate transporter receptor subunit TctC
VPDPLAPGQVPLAAQSVPVLKDFDVTAWTGFMSPRNTPPAIVTTLNTAIGEILKDGAFQEQIVMRGNAPSPPSGPDAMAKQIRTDQSKWDGVIKTAGLKPD